MKKFTFKSKLFVPTGIKNKAVYVLVCVCAVILGICGIISIVTGGIAAGVSMIVIPAVVVPALSRKRKRDIDNFYEFSMATVCMDGSQAVIEYSKGLKILMEKGGIQTAEYKTELEGIRLFGNYIEFRDVKRTEHISSEFIIYCSLEDAEKFAKDMYYCLGLERTTPAEHDFGYCD